MNLNREMTINEVLRAMREAQETGEELTTSGLWYDWFCKTSSLENKGKNLLAKLKAVVKALMWNEDGSNYYKKFSVFDTYVFFKNSCPVNGSLTDEFKICDKKTGNVLYSVTPKSGYRCDEGKAVLWGKENDFKEPLVQGTWADVKNFFKGK